MNSVPHEPCISPENGTGAGRLNLQRSARLNSEGAHADKPQQELVKKKKKDRRNCGETTRSCASVRELCSREKLPVKTAPGGIAPWEGDSEEEEEAAAAGGGRVFSALGTQVRGKRVAVMRCRDGEKWSRQAGGPWGWAIRGLAEGSIEQGPFCFLVVRDQEHIQ